MSAKVQSGSPGRFGICTARGAPSRRTSSLTLTGWPLPTLRLPDLSLDLRAVTERVDRIGHEGEVPGLLAVSDDRQGSPARLGQKDTEHGAVSPASARPWSVNVEKAHRYRRQW